MKNEETNNLLENEKRRNKFQKKCATFAATISGISLLGSIVGLKGLFTQASTEATPSSFIKITINGGILIISTKIIKAGIEEYSISKRKSIESQNNINNLEEQQKILKK